MEIENISYYQGIDADSATPTNVIEGFT